MPSSVVPNDRESPAGAPPSGPPPDPVPLGEALAFWAKLGFISFGGPAGQIALMHEHLVERRRWISERRFMHALNYCMLLPGPEAQQLATYLGWLMHRSLGGVLAGLLFVLPSFCLIGLIAWAYQVYGHLPAFSGLLEGIKPAVIALVLAAGWRIGQRTLKGPRLWLIAVSAFVALHALAIPFPLVILAAAAVGAIRHRRQDTAASIAQKVRANGAADAAMTTGATGHGVPAPKRDGAAISRTESSIPASPTPPRALIDDDTPVPDHARARPLRFLAIAVAGAVLWGLGWWVCSTLATTHSTLTDMAYFFTQAALVTFGGAYAVLPYVHQAAVEHYGWLTAAQMLDALALGETTPGPLIMIVTFVGFLGGWTQQALGGDSLALAGWAGAFAATYFTFLPSFIFILAGGPLVESTRSLPRLDAALSAITAAVVGVIASLALVLAQAVLLRTATGSPDWMAVGATLLAVWMLVLRKLPVMTTIVVFAAAGLALRLAGIR